MRTNIVVKLFLLTSGLCLLIVGSIYVGQTILFEDYYANNKMNDLSQAVESFKLNYQSLEEDEINQQELEQQFYQENNAWITVLDKDGYIKGTKDFYITLNGGFVAENDDINYTDQSYVIPIFYLEDTYNENEKIDFFKKKENHFIEIQGIEKNGEFYPAELILSTEESLYEEQNPFSMLNGGLDNVDYWKNKLLSTEIDENAKNNEAVQSMVYGSIDDVNIPSDNSILYSNTLSNQLFLNTIKQFQSDLIFNEVKISKMNDKEYKENGINYRLLINEGKDDNGETIYYLTMASLQPIDEAVAMMKDYYIYIIIAVVVLILLVAFYYSKMIASPLLKVNEGAKRIANLDFEEKISVATKDEIGELAENINFLSDTLHDYIQTLQQDIEKERQLENTRKNFIASVSHELKTPLSIMKSCISILQDEVAIDKREHYFLAMNKEVDRMDRLIVDMLELAKFESGTYKMNMEKFWINDMINNVYQQLFIKAKNKGLIIDLKLQAIEVVANHHWIEQVITNFLTNAIRHTPESGQIIISTISEKEKVRVMVENEGNRIDPNQLEKVWDRFYQTENNQRSKEGTGLGLAISKNILTLHNTEYGVFNTRKGVCFYFYLNISE